MGNTQISFPVWNHNQNLSWVPDRKIPDIPDLFSDFLVENLGSPILLFQIRKDIIDLLRNLPENLVPRAIIEIDIGITPPAREILEDSSNTNIYNIGRWLTNQFSTSYFHGKVGKKVPNVVIHISEMEDSEELGKGYKIYVARNFSSVKKRSTLNIILPKNSLGDYAQYSVQHNMDKVTEFGSDYVCRALGWKRKRVSKYYPFLAKRHIEIASTISNENLERLWIKHFSYHETWKVSENTNIWEPIASRAWVPVLTGNVLVLGRAVPVYDVEGDPKSLRMMILPGSILLKVGQE